MPLQGKVVIGLEDDQLEDWLQTWLVQLTGLPGDMVRPAFQADPPPIPPFEATWLAFNISGLRPDWDPVISRDGTVVQRNEQVTVDLTFYGKSGGMADAQLRMAVMAGGNLAYLAAGHMSFVSYTDPTKVSEKIKGRFQRRWDARLLLRRTLQFVYAVPDIASVTGEISSQSTSVSFATAAPGE